MADLADTIDPERVLQEACSRGLEVMPLAAYFAGRGTPPPALVLGFGSVDPNAVRRGIETLAEALDASRVGNRRVQRRTRGA